jgi:hypothetical protein
MAETAAWLVDPAGKSSNLAPCARDRWKSVRSAQNV